MYMCYEHMSLGAVTFPSLHFKDESSNMLLKDVACTGNEISIINCRYTRTTDENTCTADHAAGVQCPARE